MIIIQSSSWDRSTDDVIQWLTHLGARNLEKFFDDSILGKIEILFDNNQFECNINDVDITKKYWYRRGRFIEDNSTKFDYPLKEFLYANNKENVSPLINFLKIQDSKNGHINSFKDTSILKLNMLRYCVELKIKIPKTMVTGNIFELSSKFDINQKIITKSIENPILKIAHLDQRIIFDPVIKILSGIDLITSGILKTQPSLFQEYVEKQFEIRSFYLNGIFKSMAIFSQQNEKTKEDFRNYDYSRPNRNVPFQLPKSLEKKLHKLMVKMDLNCGSFDIIYTPSGEYYFLEVNPVGQFQWLSYNCNYFIEKLIAEGLIN